MESPSSPSSIRWHSLILAAIILTFSAVVIGCKTKVAKVAVPEINEAAMNYVQQGDAFLHEYHLYGWRQAETLYAKAYDLTHSAEIGKKLLLARFLVLTREMDESIHSQETDKIFKDLCGEEPYQRTLCGIAEWFRNGKDASYWKLHPMIFRGEDPALENYINLLLFKAIPLIDSFAVEPMTANAIKQSPLFLYLNSEKLSSMNPEEFEEAYPQFAEGFEIIADALVQKKTYRLARKFFQKSTDLIPNYTKANVGLGNLFFYQMDNPDGAMAYFSKALEADPDYVPALFGKSLALNQMGKHEESNTFLDRILADYPKAEKHFLSVSEAKYYQGQSYYLKASNHHGMNDAIKARQFIDSAQKILPLSAEINYLSGLLFYQSNDLESARRDFTAASERDQNCDAQLYLGMIYQKFAASNEHASVLTEKSAEAADVDRKTDRSTDSESPAKKSQLYYIGAAACIDFSVKELRNNFKKMDSADLDKSDLQLLKIRLEKKIADTRATSSVAIERILAQFQQDNGNKSLIAYLNEVLTRLRTP